MSIWDLLTLDVLSFYWRKTTRISQEAQSPPLIRCTFCCGDDEKGASAIKSFRY